MKKDIGNIFIGVAAVVLLALLMPISRMAADVSMKWSREISVLVIILMLIFLIARAQKRRSYSLLRNLRWLGLTALTYVIILTILKAHHANQTLLNVPHKSDMLTTVLAVAGLFLSVIILMELGKCIFIERGKKTAINFTIVIAIILLHIIVDLADLDKDGLLLSVFRLNTTVIPANIVLVLLWVFSIINGFRCKWIHYLNRRQKMGIFFIGVFLSGWFIFLGPQCKECIENVTQAGSVFVSDIHLFFIIYSSMALLGLLFQLPSAGIMDRRMRQIRYLQDLGAKLGSVLEKDQLLATCADLTIQMVNADLVWIELTANDELVLAWSAGKEAEKLAALDNTRTSALRENLDDNPSALLVNDCNKNSLCRVLADAPLRGGSLLAAAITHSRTTLGYLYALKRNRFAFSEENRGLFKAFTDMVGVALQNSNLMQITIQQQVYREELRLAHDAQMRLLPQQMPQVTGMELAGFCDTANEIGGDFYYVLPLSDDRVDFIIGDVSGIGASAAFYMAELKGLIEALSRHHDTPEDILADINGFIRKNFEPDTFVTMIYSIYFCKQKKLLVARAGHPPFLHLHDDKVSLIETGGLGLGLATNESLRRTLKTTKLRLSSGDRVIFLTDGLLEARNQEGKEFGEEGLTEAVIRCLDCGAEEMASSIRQSMTDFMNGVPRHDDVTLLSLKVL